MIQASAGQSTAAIIAGGNDGASPDMTGGLAAPASGLRLRGSTYLRGL